MSSLSCVRLFVTPWTVAHQAPLSMRFSRQEYWSGLPFPTPGLSCMSRSYILEINPLSVELFASVFSQFVGCLFILFMVSFAVQKLLSLIRSHLFIFVLCPQVKCLDFPKSFYPALFWDLRFSICVSQSTLLSPGVCGSAVPCSVYSVHHCFFGF